MSGVDDRGYALQRGEGRTFWWTSDMLREEKVDSSRTDGRFAVSEVTVEPGYASPPHVHHREDEAVYVLGGTLTVYLSPDLVTGGPGTFFFMPRGIPHSWIVGKEEPGRLLVMLSPGGFERFYAEHGTPADGGGPPTAPTMTREDVERVMREEYGIELVPPPPGYPSTNV